MEREPLYTLEQLAEEFGLTPRMARYYVEKLLPEHHKTGRGKLAEYGPDTWNCFAFIQRARDELKLGLDQIREVLAKLDQRQIDRVARGEEEIAIVTTPAEPELPATASARFYPRRGWKPEADRSAAPASPDMIFEATEPEPPKAARRIPGADDFATPNRPEGWHTIYEDAEVRIQCRGTINEQQSDEVRVAAKLIRRILEQQN